MTALHRGEWPEFRSRWDAALQIVRLMWVSDAFLAQALYRLKARLQALGVPVLPRLARRLARRLAMAIAQLSIGDPVIVHPGVYIPHGQVVFGGLVEIHQGSVIGPFVTRGMRAGNAVRPTIDRNVSIGTGATLIRTVRVGTGSRVGANAVVVNDVPEGATIVGVTAHPVIRE